MIEPVKCPICGRRLFDREGSLMGCISIKCPVCKKVSRLQLEKVSIKRALKCSAAIPSNGVN